MPNKRPIPKVDLSDYYEQNILTVKPKGNDLRIEIGGDRCRTILLNQVETLEFLLTIIKGGKKIWNDAFVDALVGNVEKL